MQRSLLLVVVLSAGCVAELDEPGVEVADDGTSSRIALNGLTAFSADSLTTTPEVSLFPSLAAGTLPTSGTRVPSMFATAHSRDQFAYLYSCAEKAGKTLRITANGTSYTFTGALGLAPEWTTKALPATKHKLVSACMLARTNYFGVEVSISMRSQKIATPNAELSAYTVIEGAFWGDVFSSTSSIHACASPAKLSGEAISTLPLRECTVSEDGVTTKCGFTYAGDCTSVCFADPKLGYAACAGYDDDTITVYVAAP